MYPPNLHTEPRTEAMPILFDDEARQQGESNLSYPGGKAGAGVYQQIINLMPPHYYYAELFLGSGAVMQMKRPAVGGNLGLDLNSDAIKTARRRLATERNEGLKPEPFHFAIGDALQFLKININHQRPQENVLYYCDPPYLMETRKQKREIYEHEFTAEQHEELLRQLKGVSCMVMISGYRSSMYSRQLKDWNHIKFTTTTRGNSLATEYVWYNFPTPTELHDYRYLGNNFRERERIKRKQKRWTDRLRIMPRLERQALLAAIQNTQEK